MKILVIQNKMIGDVLTSSILFEALRKQYPKASLHYLIQPHTVAVLGNNPFIDQLLLFDPKQQSTWEMAQRVKAEQYDIVIDVYAKLNSALITALSGAAKRISYRKWYTSPVYTTTVERKTKADTVAGLAIENRMLLLQGLIPDAPQEIKPKIYLSEEEKLAAQQKLIEEGISIEEPLLMMSILGSSPEKTYPLKAMAELLDFIVAEKKPQLLFNYIPSQLEDAEKLYNLTAPETQKHIYFDLYGRNLREFIALTSQCDAVIGNEGGAINMAKAVGVPTFAIFSPQIRKEDWSLYEDQKKNSSVHLNDFLPGLFEDLSKKQLQKKGPQFYELLKPKLIFAALQRFLRLNLK